VRYFAVLLFLATNLAAETIHVSVHQTTVVKFAHATAAYAVDPSIADAVARAGEVSVSGKSTGATQIVVVTGNGQLIFDVSVTAPIGAAPQKQKRGGTEGRIEARYGTAERQTHGIIDVGHDASHDGTTAEGTRRTELHVESVHYGASASYRAATTLPSVSYRIFTPGRELTFFDRLTDESPLTISNTTVRGLHFISDRWRVHAGTTAFTSYQSFLIPAQHQNLLDAAFRINANVTAGALITSKGSVASMLYDYRPSDRLFARGELAVSRGVGAAAQFGLDGDRDRVRADLRYRPRDFVNISPRATLLSGNDDFSGQWLPGALIPGELRNVRGGRSHLGRHSMVGAHSVVLPGVSFGEGAVVGALSLVKETLAPWGVYGGVPARWLRPRDRGVEELAAQVG